MDRASLARGVDPPLVAVGPEDRKPMLFRSHGRDPYESNRGMNAVLGGIRLNSCAACHSQEPGIHSVQIRRQLSFRQPTIPLPQLAALSATRERQIVVSWKQRQADWGRLSTLLESGE